MKAARASAASRNSTSARVLVGGSTRRATAPQLQGARGSKGGVRRAAGWLGAVRCGSLQAVEPLALSWHASQQDGLGTHSASSIEWLAAVSNGDYRSLHSSPPAAQVQQLLLIGGPRQVLEQQHAAAARHRLVQGCLAGGSCCSLQLGNVHAGVT